MYVDTAILVKLFTREPDSEFFGQMVDGESLSSSWLAYTELWSALLTKERSGSISESQRQRAWQSFEGNVEAETLYLLPISQAIVKKANWLLLSCHPAVQLRSLDALHLASCDQLQDWPLCTTDKRMRAAAVHLNFKLADLPPVRS